MYRPLVIGNCQAYPLARCLDIIAPQCRSAWFAPTDLRDRFPSVEAGLEFVHQFEVVITQDFDPVGGYSFAAVKDASRSFLAYPNVQFGAFHPDCVYAADGRAETYGMGLRSPVGDYHSALVLFGFTQGLDARQIKRLFSEVVFERLGYYDFWREAQELLRERFQGTEFDFDPMFSAWARTGCFMHSFNHPHLTVSKMIAAHLADLLQLQGRSPECCDLFQDPGLSGPVWPVYPEVARRFSLDGTYLFKRNGLIMHDQPVGAMLLDLDSFITESLSLYAHFSPDHVVSSRLLAWR